MMDQTLDDWSLVRLFLMPHMKLFLRFPFTVVRNIFGATNRYYPYVEYKICFGFM